jgi:hypothetical protein
MFRCSQTTIRERITALPDGGVTAPKHFGAALTLQTPN